MPPAWAARVLPPPSYSPGIAARLRTARGLPPAFVQPGMPQIHRLRLLLGSHAFFVPIRANSPTLWAQTVALGGDWQCKPPDASLARLDLRHTRAVWGGLVLGIPSRASLAGLDPGHTRAVWGGLVLGVFWAFRPAQASQGWIPGIPGCLGRAGFGHSVPTQASQGWI